MLWSYKYISYYSTMNSILPYVLSTTLDKTNLWLLYDSQNGWEFRKMLFVQFYLIYVLAEIKNESNKPSILQTNEIK